MTATVASYIDASSSTATVGTTIDALNPGRGRRIGSFTVGTRVTFYAYDVE